MKVAIEPGMIFGTLEVIADEGIRGGRRYFLCKCECGRTMSVSSANLPGAKSCGCKNLKWKAALGIDGRTNKEYVNLYNVWRLMRRRCYGGSKGSEHYGGRGIGICEEWKENFAEFYKWSMSNGYKKLMQIDRIDNSGNYEPSNCRWVTKVVNARNTRHNVYLTYSGESKTIAEWAESIGINKDVLYKRVRYGWSDKQIIETPIKTKQYV